MLPKLDADYLSESAPEHDVRSEGGMLCVIVRDFRLPGGLSSAKADLLLRLAPGYPDVPPDMWWFDPSVKRLDGRVIPATEVFEQHLGRTWQRWSRHLNGGQWRPGRDSLESYITLIRQQLEIASQSIAA
jgi:hypothetical protein